LPATTQAVEVVVRVEFTQSKVKLNITDNGNGFKIPKEPGGFARRGKLGLMGMKERAHLLCLSLPVCIMVS